MSLRQTTDLVAARSRHPTVTAESLGGGPGAQQLLTNIGAYIPTEVTTAYIAAAGGIVTLSVPLSRQKLLLIALAVSGVAAFVTWVLGHRKAAAEAVLGKTAVPSLLDTLRSGWYEIAAAAVAFFAWATAMPGSWYGWGTNVVWGPGLLVFIVSVAVGGLATLLNRNA